jgi:hypothetical protein
MDTGNKNLEELLTAFNNSQLQRNLKALASVHYLQQFNLSRFYNSALSAYFQPAPPAVNPTPIPVPSDSHSHPYHDPLTVITPRSDMVNNSSCALQTAIDEFFKAFHHQMSHDTTPINTPVAAIRCRVSNPPSPTAQIPILATAIRNTDVAVEESSNKCPHCALTAPDHATLIRHHRSNHKEHKIKIKCSECKYKTSQIFNLTRHR